MLAVRGAPARADPVCVRALPPPPQVAFYFAWLGFYTTWLIPISLLGMAVYSNQRGANDPSADIVRRRGWHCSSGRRAPRADYLVESALAAVAPPSPHSMLPPPRPAQVLPYALTVALWAALFVESWKRKEHDIAMRWGMTGCVLQAGGLWWWWRRVTRSREG